MKIYELQVITDTQPNPVFVCYHENIATLEHYCELKTFVATMNNKDTKYEIVVYDTQSDLVIGSDWVRKTNKNTYVIPYFSRADLKLTLSFNLHNTNVTVASKLTKHKDATRLFIRNKAKNGFGLTQTFDNPKVSDYLDIYIKSVIELLELYGSLTLETEKLREILTVEMENLYTIYLNHTNGVGEFETLYLK